MAVFQYNLKMAKNKYPTLVLELAHRRKSAFILEGTEKSPEPDILDCASEYMLRNTSVVLIGGKRVKTRYIAGSDMFKLDEQVKADIRPNPLQDIIYFTFGRLTVNREGLNVGLYDFLVNHEGNRDNPNRPPNAEDVFYTINTEADAESQLADLDETAEVMTYLSSLRKDKPGKEKGYIYDTEKIERMCKMLGVIPVESDAEKLKILVATGVGNPRFFLQLLNAKTADLRVEVVTAREMGVISIDGESASFTENGENFYKFKNRNGNYDSRITELVDYFGTEAADMHLSIVKAKLEFAKEKALE